MAYKSIHRPLITEEMLEKWWMLSQSGIESPDIARRFGISSSQVYGYLKQRRLKEGVEPIVRGLASAKPTPFTSMRAAINAGFALGISRREAKEARNIDQGISDLSKYAGPGEKK
jgi:hypothetical protein